MLGFRAGKCALSLSKGTISHFDKLSANEGGITVQSSERPSSSSMRASLVTMPASAPISVGT
jgi:hypothetical protein